MNWWLPLGLALSGMLLMAVVVRLGWIDLSNKSRRGGGGALGIGDEIFHPTRHEAQIELDRQTVLPAPAPLPGDGAEKRKGVYEGQVRIDLSER